MPEYGFSLARIFPYKERIVDFVFMWESAGQKKPVFWHILLHEKCPYLELFWSVFSRIRTRITPNMDNFYSVSFAM